MPSYLDNDIWWEDYDDATSIRSSASANSSAQDIDIIEPILSAPQHKSHTETFVYAAAFTKGITDGQIFYEVPNIDTRKFDNYNRF